ncbi:hypothetical protein H7K38_02640 [Mycobacterium alsense]|uniref:Uncharacterized protein n=1 Tax=Mycobacterium alsense TaxID=324058 RepID=A0AA41XIV2_9MYCO|nr:hypothetical protein [Mycobacterium alsense]MCV7377551.1 hypothetical protein [Mycobacterium alsense]
MGLDTSLVELASPSPICPPRYYDDVPLNRSLKGLMAEYGRSVGIEFLSRGALLALTAPFGVGISPTFAGRECGALIGG